MTSAADGFGLLETTLTLPSPLDDSVSLGPLPALYVTLDNQLANPSFEAPSGPGVQVFNDPFANVSAYATQAGGNPSVSSNVARSRRSLQA